MKYTPNYELKKPEQDDFYDVKDFNDNADIIDQALKAHDDALATKETPAGAQAKANTAEANAKAYTDAHEQKAAPHSGHETPAGAQAKAEAAAGVVQAELDAHKTENASTSQKGHVQLSTSTTSTSTSLAATASAVKTVNDALTSHKADIGAHNGFVGQHQNLPHFTDFNELTTPGLYHGVISGERLNEAVTISSIRRLTLQVTVNNQGYVHQELYYPDGVSSIKNRRFYKHGDPNTPVWSPWFEIKTSIDIERGQGSPEGVISATVGTLYQRTDVGELYVKKTGTGNTGWKAVQTT